MKKETEIKIKSYIEKYASKHGITYEQAKEHAMCKAAEFFYKQEDKRDGTLLF